MAQIPRAFLNKPKLPTTGGTRQVAARQDQPGAQLHADAAMMANQHGLDLTPIGNALYQTGKEFVAMERERRAMELVIQEKKQEMAARSTIMQGTAAMWQIASEIEAEKHNDPETVRRIFQERFNARRAQDIESLKGIGDFAVEAYDQEVYKIGTSLQPKLTGQAVALSKQMMEKDLRTQLRTAVTAAATVESDEVAGQIGDQALDSLRGANPFMTEGQLFAMEQEFNKELVAARYGHKIKTDPHGAWMYLQGRTDLDDDSKHQILTRGIQELTAHNSLISAQQKAQMLAIEKAQDDLHLEISGKVEEAITNKEYGQMARLSEFVIANRAKLGNENFDKLARRINANLNPPKDEDFTGKAGQKVWSAINDIQVPTAQARAVLAAEQGRLSPREYNRAEKVLAEREKGTYEPVQRQYKDAERDLRAWVRGNVVVNTEKIDHKDFKGDYTLTLKMLRENREDEIVAGMMRTLQTYGDTLLQTDDPRGFNYQQFRDHLPKAMDLLKKQWEGHVTQFNAPVPMPGGSFKNMMELYRQGKLSEEDRAYYVENHVQAQQKAQGGQLQLEQDPVFKDGLARGKALIDKWAATIQSKFGSPTPSQGAQPEAAPAKEEPPEGANAISAETGKPIVGQSIGTTVNKEGFAGLQQSYGLGALSATEESAGDPAAIGPEPDGTTSYGLFQINSRNVPSFIRSVEKSNPAMAGMLRGAQPNTPAFERQWKMAAQTYGQEFNNAQVAYAQEKHYAPAVKTFTKVTGIPENEIPDPVKMAIFSASIQHGGYRHIFSRMKEKLPQNASVAPAEMIRAFYEARADYVNDLSTLNSTTKGILAKRYARETERALAMLEA